MKVAFIGVGHWHTPLYLDPLLEIPDARVVGISDPDPDVVRTYSERLGCIGTADPGDIYEKARPDLVFVLGHHADMPTQVLRLIEEKIPFVVEKPGGLDEGSVRDLANAARKAGVFNAVPLVFRSSGFMQAIHQHAAGERLLYADFKFVAGLPSRYHQAGCSWVFDRNESGGGTLINLGVHFIDLFQRLSSVEGVKLTDAKLANLQGQGNVDDYAALTLDNGGSVCRVETAYLYPAPGGIFDMHFSARTENHYFKVTGPGVTEVSDMKGNRQTVEGATTNMPLYPIFVAEVLEQLRTGAKPVADLEDMASVLKIVDDAYRNTDPL
jgi:predicted dehydrogenase